jgi:prepilin-type processing-associated H-X9-DG protein
MLLDDKNGVNPLPKVGTNNIWTCPTAAGPTNQDAAEAGATYDKVSPTRPDFYEFWGADSTGVLLPKKATSTTIWLANPSYVMNSNLMDSVAPTFNKQVCEYNVTVRMSQLRPAGSVVLMVEKLADGAEYMDPSIVGLCDKYPNTTGKNHFLNKTSGPYIGFNNGVAQLKSNWKRFAARHNAGGNILFADGHVAYYKWVDVQLYKNRAGTVLEWSSSTTAAPTSFSKNDEGQIYDANSPEIVWNPFGPCN